MKPKADEPLLVALFAEDLSGDYSAEMLARTLREVRVRRRRAATIRSGLLAAGALVVGLLLAMRMSRRWANPDPGRIGPTIVRTEPLGPGLLVQPSAASVTVLGSRIDTVSVVETIAPDAQLEWLDDARLFGVAEGQPIGIVRPEYATAQVVWADADGVTWR